jgi:hypothetical protein
MSVSYSELVDAIRKVLPEAQFTEDNDGQIVIYAGVIEEEGEVMPYDGG